MARSVNEIQQAIITDVTNTPELSTLASNTSRRAIWRLWTFIVATAIAILEQLIDVFKSTTEATIAAAAPETAAWLQAQFFKFQYSTTTPQVIQLINLVPQYPVVDENLRIITRCSVRTTINNQVLIKLAKQDPPTPLDSSELAASQSYVNIIGVAGVNYICVSQDSDKLYIQADVYYNGAYSSVISANVIDAITTYLANLPFDGAVKVNDLELIVRAVAGVNDIVFKNVKARENSVALSSATYLIQNSQLIGRLWSTVAGYIVPETTSGSTLTDTLNFIAE
jgi:hypothetical protein